MSCCVAKQSDEEIWQEGQNIARRAGMAVGRPIITGAQKLQQSLGQTRRKFHPSNGFTMMEMVLHLDWAAYESALLTGWVKGTDQVLRGSTRAGLAEHGFTMARKDVIEFEIGREMSLEWIRNRGAAHVTGITDATRKAIQDILQRGIAENRTTNQMIRDIHDVIGLSPRDANLIMNRRAQLEKAGVPQRAIERQLRALKKKKLKQRAFLVGGTETMAARNQGTVNAWKVLEREGQLEPGMHKEWIAMPGCVVCAAIMEKGPVPLNSFFFAELQGTFHDAPPAHPGCRCSMGLARPPES